MTARIDLTADQKAELGALAAVLNLDQIADYFGFSPATLDNILKRDDESLRLYKKGKSVAIKDVGGSLIEQARAGDTTSMIFYLKTQAGWREVQQVESNNKNETIIRVVADSDVQVPD